MANISKLNLKGHETGVSEVSKWISQINVGDTIYDIATHHGITFENGSDSIEWNGVTDIVVTIPTLDQLVKDPIKFIGTVGADGKVMSGLKEVESFTKGDLVFITANCTFGGKSCESGDMAVYDGTNWVIVSGENQIVITGIAAGESEKTFTLTATAQDVLTVEGKSLKLNIDYTGVKDVLSQAMNADVKISVKGGTVEISSKGIALSKVADTTKDISTAVSIDLPTSLANGAVTINQSVLEASNFVFTSGVLPTLKKNASAVAANVCNQLSINSGDKGATGDFVASIDGAVKSVSIDGATSASYNFVTLSASKTDSSLKSFISKIHVKTKDETATTDFTIPGKPSISGISTFVSGLSEASNAGQLVSAITVGSVSLVAGSDIVTGISTAVSGSAKDVITDVTIGDVQADNNKDWFLTGLSSGTEVVTGVTVGATSFVSDVSSTFASSALTSASVSGNVLVFNSGSFMTPVSLTKASDTITKTTFTKGGVKLSGFAVKSADFTKGKISQADTTISYKNVLTGTVSLSFAADTEYIFDKQAQDAWTFTPLYYKLDVTPASISYRTPTLGGTITAGISANTFVTDFSVAGTLPSFEVKTATGTLTGSVETSLSTSNVSWLGVNSESKTVVTAAGAYTLVESSDADAITVASAGEYNLASATVTIPSDTFVTAVNVSGTAISKS